MFLHDCLGIQWNSEDISLEEEAVVDLYLARVISEVLELSNVETEKQHLTLLDSMLNEAY